METIKFKTSVNCNNCIRAITPFLNKVNGISLWDVDLNDPARILTVVGIAIKPGQVIDALFQAGYRAEQLD
jgi:copper chaperone CopZ